jgi:hypothetical protein
MNKKQNKAKVSRLGFFVLIGAIAAWLLFLWFILHVSELT